jgi:hypothetical protein|tara:strand:- start:17075 stop:17296 length:222 start_codon:yes stop_codon:yes gene_type:complete
MALMAQAAKAIATHAFDSGLKPDKSLDNFAYGTCTLMVPDLAYFYVKIERDMSSQNTSSAITQHYTRPTIIIV